MDIKRITSAAAASFGAAAVLAVHANASPAPVPGAAPFVAGVVRLTVLDRYGALWDELHPAQQALLPRSTYVRCESLSPVPGVVTAVRILSVRPQRVLVPGLGRSVASTAVRFRVAVAVAGGTVTVTHTIHAVRVGSRWTWFLAAAHLAAYRGGGCPGAPASGGPSI